MCSFHDLLIRADQFLHERLMPGGRNFSIPREHSKIVDAFEQNKKRDTGPGENVAIEPGKCVGAELIEEHAISADANIQHADVCCAWR
jgi:hypothetical protein